MNVKALKLADVRAIHAAELRFLPGFNIVAGGNGVGKTTILDALAVCCSAVARRTNGLRRYGTYFGSEEVRLGGDALQVQCDFECRNGEFGLSVYRSQGGDAEQGVEEWSREYAAAKDASLEEFYGDVPAKSNGETPTDGLLAILYSTARSVATERTPRHDAASGTTAAAFAGALSVRRGLELGEFAAWMHVQQVLGSERAEAKGMLVALEDAVARFLPGYRNLRPGQDRDGQTLLIDHDDQSLPVRWLSDGERGVLSLVLDLTRRLAQANPDLVDPAANAEAVVLIDELELHLHPAWQRRIVANLTETFPRCQFIATTHSPQVIGEIEHDRIHMISDGEVYTPTHSFGVDSSRVLEEIMGARARNSEIEALIRRISLRIDDDRYDDARELLVQLAERVGEGDPEVTRGRTLLDFLEDE